MAFAWDILYAIALFFTSPVWGYRLFRTGKWRTDWHAKRGFAPHLPPLKNADRRLLIYGVSLGEINAIRSLVDLLHQRDPGLQIVVAASTDTGWARANELFAQRETVVRYPLDFSRCVERFLDRVRPTAVALVELEVWPNFIAACTRRKIPVSVVNGRLSARSFARYRLVRPFIHPSFAALAAAGVQTDEYAQRFRALGTPPDRVHVLDTMKWDTAQIADQVPGADDLARAMGIDRTGQRPLIVAGSTAPGEEELLIRTCPQEAQLLLVPRKPERFEEVAALAPGIIRRTQHPSPPASGNPETSGTPNPAAPQINNQPVESLQVERQSTINNSSGRLFLLDTMGELRKAYALADVVIVGRSFLGLAGSDLIEPIALGKPTIIGYHHSAFAEVVAAMQGAHGVIVTDRPGVEAARLLANPAAARQLAENGRGVILTRQGATQRHADMLLEILKN